MWVHPVPHEVCKTEMHEAQRMMEERVAQACRDEARLMWGHLVGNFRYLQHFAFSLAHLAPGTMLKPCLHMLLRGMQVTWTCLLGDWFAVLQWDCPQLYTRLSYTDICSTVWCKSR